MAPPISSDVINQEADARFWAQTGYKPGQKLDPKNPTDKAMAPVWMDIFRKVRREAEAGTLVTTYDHPAVAQDISDAAVAGRAAAEHATAAVTAPDPTLSQDNVAAATTAAQISAQKAREAAAKQPPTVDPQLVRDAGQEAAKAPPPPQASAGDHLAHEHVQEHAYDHARDVHARAEMAPPSREALYRETNVRFWTRTRYKPGQRLDMSIAQDREMARVWMEIFRQVQREADAGTLVFTSPDRVPVPTIPPPSMPAPPMMPPPGAVRPPVGPPMGPSAPRLPMGPPVLRPPMMPPMGPPMTRPSMMPPMTHPPMMPPLQRPPAGPLPQPTMGPPGAPIPPPAAPPTPAPGAPGGEPGGPAAGAPGEVPPGAPAETMPPPEEKPSNIGKYIAIGIAVVAGGGLLYYATTRKPSPRRSSPRPRTRSPRPSAPPPPPPSAAPSRMVRGLLPAPASELGDDE